MVVQVVLFAHLPTGAAGRFQMLSAQPCRKLSVPCPSSVTFVPLWDLWGFDGSGGEHAQAKPWTLDLVIFDDLCNFVFFMFGVLHMVWMCFEYALNYFESVCFWCGQPFGQTFNHFPPLAAGRLFSPFAAIAGPLRDMRKRSEVEGGAGEVWNVGLGVPGNLQTLVVPVP